MKLLSLIIPSYNSERFLAKCIDSILDGGVSEQIEIIIVNDGSVDSTESIASEYCLRYPHTVRLVSQENRGHGGAINAGCAVAEGKYLKVIDADDWVVSESLNPFLEWLSEINSDVVLTNYYTYNISDNTTKKITSYMPEFGREYSLQEIISNWRDFDRTVTFHGIAYNTKFYKNNFRMLTEHVFFEDHEFSTFPCCYAKTVMPLDLFVYCYRIGDVEQSVSDSNQLKRVSHYEAVVNRIVDDYKSIRSTIDVTADNFICLKTKILLMSYLTVLLLIESNRKYGRKKAKTVIENTKLSMPKVYDMVNKKYKVLCFMNRFGIKKSAMDKLMSSKLYRSAKGAHDLD